MIFIKLELECIKIRVILIIQTKFIRLHNNTCGIQYPEWGLMVLRLYQYQCYLSTSLNSGFNLDTDYQVKTKDFSKVLLKLFTYILRRNYTILFT